MPPNESEFVLKDVTARIEAGRARLNAIADEKLRLEKEAARIRDQAALDRDTVNIAIGRHMTRPLLDLLLPEHGRTTCSDDNLANGFKQGQRMPRCNRCALLQLMAAPPADAAGITITLNLEAAVDTPGVL